MSHKQPSSNRQSSARAAEKAKPPVADGGTANPTHWYKTRFFLVFIVLGLLMTSVGSGFLLAYAAGASNNLDTIGTNIAVGWSPTTQVQMSDLEIGIIPGTNTNQTSEMIIDVILFAYTNQTFKFVLLSPYQIEGILRTGNQGSWTYQNYSDLGSAINLEYTPNATLKGYILQTYAVLARARAGLLSGILIDAGTVGGYTLNFEAANEDAEKVLAEASAVAEQRMKEKFPEIPVTLPSTEGSTEGTSY